MNGCNHQEQTLFACGGCYAVLYCGPVCQRADWHRHECIGPSAASRVNKLDTIPKATLYQLAAANAPGLRLVDVERRLGGDSDDTAITITYDDMDIAREEAMAGDPKAMVALGAYLSQFVDEDEEEGVMWLRKALELGEPSAYSQLADVGRPEDDEFQLYLKGALLGDILSMSRLINLFWDRLDPHKAYEYAGKVWLYYGEHEFQPPRPDSIRDMYILGREIDGWEDVWSYPLPRVFEPYVEVYTTVMQNVRAASLELIRMSKSGEIKFGKDVAMMFAKKLYADREKDAEEWYREPEKMLKRIKR